MAAETRASSRAVVAKLAALRERPYEFGFFAALRLLESVYAEAPRIGTAVRPADEPVRLGQEPSLSFANATLADCETLAGGETLYLSSYFLGLFGPHGALPTHLTEYAFDREHSHRDRTFRRFADLFHHRMLSLFYRAWADAQPTVSLDRADDRRFDRFAGSLVGVASDALRERDGLHDHAKFYWAGWLGQAVPAAGSLPAMLRDFLDVDFAVHEFAGEWLALEQHDQTRLGTGGSACCLGEGAVLGTRIWACQHRFQLESAPLDLATFESFLPGGERLPALRDIVRNALGDAFDWDCRLQLRADAVPSTTLGGSGRLGWTSWLGEWPGPDDAGDVVVSPANYQDAATSGITLN